MSRFALLGAASLLALFTALPLYAEEAMHLSVADLYKDKAALNGKLVQLQGKVVKVNNEVMKRNFIHIQDGSGNQEQGTNDITITSQETANKGDQVVIEGKLVLDTDFGYGYVYPLLVEEATIKPAP
ncbi:hypothetical protein Mmc1_2522 [Magnetococcus marinus MC-1]|uniref:Nucleic acid binding, OB-fold, tRNA/helicase-type n=1 Tax=Magnetococcus marinus (strain ATCC BAA-1437 / JCM 17883 / MC-1) TaxID=156889 RepID=A0LAM9_MAGMM|nr:hypothetical protein [Magnetococcus marinus]ABK45022.1 hypothetical protein Mmc1_2522 [Magnetococcus marinus MC-1]